MSSTGSLADRAALKKKELEERIILRSIIVPTDDKVVSQALNNLREVLFNTPEKRREQLRQVLYQRKMSNLSYSIDSILKNTKPIDMNDDIEYWSVGTKQLLQFRRQLAYSSINLASERLKMLKQCSNIPLEEWKAKQKSFSAEFSQLFPVSSSAISERPITTLSVCKQDESKIAVGDMGGRLLLCQFKDDEMETIFESNEHQGRISDITWNPHVSLDDAVAHFSSCGNDGKVLFYNIESDDPFAEIDAHESRCSRLKHLNQNNFITCGFDKLIKLWDTESMECILEQQGHDREVYTIATHPDQSLLYAGDLGGKGRIWDLRSGRSISLLQDDQRGVLTSVWHPNGFWLFTAGEDKVVRLYDIRQLKQFYEIPAHSQNISHIQMHADNLTEANSLLTVSFDQTVKIWSENDWRLEFSQEAHDGKITCADWKDKLITGGFDRNVKLWDSE